MIVCDWVHCVFMYILVCAYYLLLFLSLIFTAFRLETVHEGSDYEDLEDEVKVRTVFFCSCNDA